MGFRSPYFDDEYLQYELNNADWNGSVFQYSFIPKTSGLFKVVACYYSKVDSTNFRVIINGYRVVNSSIGGLSDVYTVEVPASDSNTIIFQLSGGTINAGSLDVARFRIIRIS